MTNSGLNKFAEYAKEKGTNAKRYEKNRKLRNCYFRVVLQR